MAAVNNFDSIAAVYDRLAVAIFGKAIEKAPLVFLGQLPEVQSILIVGGGTGKILKPLINHSRGSHITYLEPSSGMMIRAKKQFDTLPGQIEFIETSVESAPLVGAGYDLIFTPFVLDLFSGNQLTRVMNILLEALKPQGHWMHSDFYLKEKCPWWQRNLMKSMHFFFEVTTKMESKSLQDFNSYFRMYPLRTQGSRRFYHGMIRTVWYQKYGGQSLGN